MNDNKLDIEEARAADEQSLREDDEQSPDSNDERALTDHDQRAFADDTQPVREPVDEVSGEQGSESSESVDEFSDEEDPERIEGITDEQFDEQFTEPSDDVFADPADSPVAAYESAASEVSDSATTSTTSTASTAEPLLAPESAEAFLERWSEVQTGFVEDPHKAVGAADALLSEVVTAYQQALEQRRTRISSAQADGGTDTEDLRLALLEYRGLLTDLLPVGGSATS